MYYTGAFGVKYAANFGAFSQVQKNGQKTCCWRTKYSNIMYFACDG